MNTRNHGLLKYPQITSLRDEKSARCYCEIVLARTRRLRFHRLQTEEPDVGEPPNGGQYVYGRIRLHTPQSERPAHEPARGIHGIKNKPANLTIRGCTRDYQRFVYIVAIRLINVPILLIKLAQKRS